VNTANVILLLAVLILSANLCICSGVDYGNVSPGFKVFDPPSAMLLNETQIIFAMVTRADLSSNIGKGVEPINVTPIMEAELKDEENGVFKIKNLTESIQTVSEINDAVWLWKIAAIKTGSHDLSINIYRFNKNLTLPGNYSMKILDNKSVIISENNTTTILKNDSIKILGNNYVKILKNNSIMIFTNNSTLILERFLEIYDKEPIQVKEDFSWKETIDSAKYFAYISIIVAILGLILNLFKDRINSSIDNRRILIGPRCIHPIMKMVSKRNDSVQTKWYEVEKGQYTFGKLKK